MVNFNLKNRFLLFVLIVIPCIFTIPLIIIAKNVDWKFMVLALIVGIISIVMIMRSVNRYPYSLNLIHWIFNYIFFFIAPAVQMLYGKFPWGTINKITATEFYTTQLFIILWQVASITTSELVFRRNHSLKEAKKWLGNRALGKKASTFLITIALVSSLIVILVDGFSLLRGVQGNILFNVNTSVYLLVTRFGRGLVIATLVGFIFSYNANRSKRSFALLVISLILALITNPVFGVARYWIGSMLIGIFLTITMSKNFGQFFTIAFIMLLLFAFPILGATRNVKTLAELFNSLTRIDVYSKSILSGDFDAFSMIAHTFKYINSGPGITLGRQLLGVLLFFIPRSFWPSKPVGSGWTVAEELGLSHYNLSSPLIAEGLINFGILGLFIFSMFFSWLFTTLDLHYWHAPKHMSVSYRLLNFTYPFLLGLFFFMNRGDLLSSFAFTIGFVASFVPLSLVIRQQD